MKFILSPKSFFAFCIVLFTLAMPILCIGVTAANDVPITFVFDDFADPTKNNLVELSGDSVINSNSLLLTKSQNNNSGSAFYKNLITLNSSGFSSYFVLNISNPDPLAWRGDGMCFVIKTDSSHTNSNTGLGGALGYPRREGNVEIYKNSLGIEFDVFDNNPPNPGAGVNGDPGAPLTGMTNNAIRKSGNHVAVHSNGIFSSTSLLATTQNDSVNMPNFKSGLDFHVWVDYNPNAVGDKLLIYTHYNNIKPATPSLSLNITLYDYLHTNNVYFGFTASSGGATAAEHTVKKWYLSNTFGSINMDGSNNYTMTTPMLTSGFNDTVRVTKNCGLIKIKDWNTDYFSAQASSLPNSTISIVPQDPSKFIIQPYVDTDGYLVFKVQDNFTGIIQCDTKLLDSGNNTIVNSVGMLKIDVSDFYASEPIADVLFTEKLDEIILDLKASPTTQTDILNLISQYNTLLNNAPKDLIFNSLSRIVNTINTYQNPFLKDPLVLLEVRNLGTKILELTGSVDISSNIFLGKTNMFVDNSKELEVYDKLKDNSKMTSDINKLFDDTNLFAKFESLLVFKIREGWKEKYSRIEIPSKIVNNIFFKGTSNIILKTSSGNICFKKHSLQNFGTKSLLFESIDDSNSIPASSNLLKKFDINLYMDDSKLTSTKGNVGIHFPYLYSGNDDHNLSVQRENPDSSFTNLGGMYNSTFDRMSFMTNHFSIYYIFNNATSFSDSNSSTWANKYISALAAKGIVSGDGTNSFRPNNLIKREEFTSMVVSSFSLMDPTATSSFSDVRSDQWYYRSIASAVKNNLIRGYSSTIFGVGDFVRRQDAATILANCLLKINKLSYPNNPESVISSYLDKNSIANYAVPSVAMLKVANIMLGDSSNNFLPETHITRAQTSAILYLALKIYSSQGLPNVLFQDFIDIT